MNLHEPWNPARRLYARNAGTRHARKCRKMPAFGDSNAPDAGRCWRRWKEIAAFSVHTAMCDVRPYSVGIVAEHLKLSGTRRGRGRSPDAMTRSGDWLLEHEYAPGEMALVTAVHPVLQAGLHALDVVLADASVAQLAGVFDQRFANSRVVARQLVRTIVEFDFLHAQLAECFAVESG